MEEYTYKATQSFTYKRSLVAEGTLEPFVAEAILKAKPWFLGKLIKKTKVRKKSKDD